MSGSLTTASIYARLLIRIAIQLAQAARNGNKDGAMALLSELRFAADRIESELTQKEEGFHL